MTRNTFEYYKERYFIVLELRKKGVTLKEIARRYGITYQAIEYIIKKGVPIQRTRKQKIKKTIDPEREKLMEKLYLFEGRDRNREMVRIRDNYTCQDCSKKWIEGTRRFDVHHLNGLCGKKSRGYDSVSSLETMITLCHKCHFNRPEHRCKEISFGRTK